MNEAPNSHVTWAQFGPLSERVVRLEEKIQQRAEAHAGRSNKFWMITIGLVTSLVCPMVVLVLITLLHLGNAS